MQYPKKWDDMSEFIVHFTRGGEGGNDYDSMMGIYSNRTLNAKNPFGMGKSICPDTESQHSVCFSDIPPGQWERLISKRKTKYGIAFRKDLLISKGGCPVWYVWKDSSQWLILNNLMQKAKSDSSQEIWKLIPFIDAPGKYYKSKYEFEWEREWRHLGDFPFDVSDVAFLLIPEALHSAAYSFFQDAYHENIGPAYFCPYIDPSWPREKILSKIYSTKEDVLK